MRKYRLFVVIALLLSTVCVSCSTDKNAVANDVSSFTGKWYSPRLKGIIDIKSDFTWETKTADGRICQSGRWQLRGNQFVWTYDDDPEGKEDINKIIKSSPDEFILKEMDKSTTKFERRN